MAALPTFLPPCAVLSTEQAVAPLQPPLSNNELGTIIILLYLKKLRHKGFQKIILSWPLKPSQPDAKASGLKLLSFPHLPLGECRKQLTAWQAHPGLTSEQSTELYINQSYGSV